jgi:hypothetical protein
MIGQRRDVVVDTSGVEYRQARQLVVHLSLTQLSSRAQVLVPRKTQGTATREEIIELAAIAAEYGRRRP